MGMVPVSPEQSSQGLTMLRTLCVNSNTGQGSATAETINQLLSLTDSAVSMK